MFIDNLFFEFVHFLCDISGGFLTPVFHFISFLADGGWFFILIGVLLLLRRKTRWIGATIVLTIFFAGSLKIIIKDIVQRPRPYLSSAKNLYEYWLAAGGYPDDGFCFPSGHVVAAASCFFGAFVSVKKEYRKSIAIAGVLAIILMTISRCYLFHHYLTDCLAAIVLSFVMSYLAKAIVKLIHYMCKKYQNISLFNFVINFDFFELFAPKRND